MPINSNWNNCPETIVRILNKREEKLRRLGAVGRGRIPKVAQSGKVVTVLIKGTNDLHLLTVCGNNSLASTILLHFSYDDWFKHFLKAKPTADDPALLILDGHNTHTKNLDFIDLARQNHTTVLCLPPHCSHRLQPLDVSFMGPVTKFYIRAVEKCHRNNPGRAITVFQFSKLFGEAYSEAAQQSIAVSGFRKCRMEPLDRHVFKDHDFLPAETTDVTLVEPEAQQNEYNKENFTPEREESPSLLDTVEETLVNTPPMFDLQGEKTLEETPAVTLPILDPLHCLKPKKIIRKRGCTVILTSCLYKKELREEKLRQEERKALKRSAKNNKIDKTTKHSKTKIQKSVINADDDDDVDNAECFYCDGWIRCSLCKQWAQEACSGCDDEDEVFLCEFCS
ncbi:unnamed protein product [Euphydryas editha]|uniref:DDE-1 domain-containing protein n=1 Tax=Euphydryas editha TaxID=104508 RepID=A0AAU9TK06_EUPED|nr:unnamed protein product [Euphydryas editha]